MFDFQQKNEIVVKGEISNLARRMQRDEVKDFLT